MNKPLLIALLVIVVALVVYLVTRSEVDTRAVVEPDKAAKEAKVEPYASCPGVKTDEQPDFDIQVEAVRAGEQNKVEFTVTELNGFCAQNVYVEFWHAVRNEETGEVEPPAADTYKLSHLLKGVVPAGKPFVDSIVLNSSEMGWLNWDEVGPDDLVARVSQWGGVFKAE